MEKLRIQGGSRLEGDIPISGAKNAALPMLAATLLTADTVHLTNVPQLRDVHTMKAVLSSLGANITVQSDGSLAISSNKITNLQAPYDLVKTMRASFLVLGPLLARFQYVEVSLPGGCAIGTRPIDQHLKALEALGATIELKEGYVTARIDGRLIGNSITMDVVTVTGTQNALMAATLASGRTTLINAAREPEVVELANMLSAMGAEIQGAGTDVITIEGKETLHGCNRQIAPDRIEAGTFLIGGAMTRGCVSVFGNLHGMLDAPLAKLKNCGAEIEISEGVIRLDMKGKRPKAIDIRTAVYPGIPTDLQAQFMALNSIADGTSRVTETIFENRFMHVPELARLGAEIENDSTTATVVGVPELHGANVMATDLRASSCLVLAGLVAKGETVVDRIYHLDRGYEKLEEKLNAVGAQIERFGD